MQAKNRYFGKKAIDLLAKASYIMRYKLIIAILKEKCVMGVRDHSNYQKKVISSYYDNLDSIMLGKLQELVTELYLADSQKKSDRLWDRANKAMVKIKIKPAIVDHIMKTRSVEVFAKNVQDWSKISTK